MYACIVAAGKKQKKFTQEIIIYFEALCGSSALALLNNLENYLHRKLLFTLSPFPAVARSHSSFSWRRHASASFST
jgi:hypothetical protein